MNSSFSSNFVNHTSSLKLVVLYDTLKIKATGYAFILRSLWLWLVLADVELIFFIDCVVKHFGFVIKTVLITRGCFSYY